MSFESNSTLYWKQQTIKIFYKIKKLSLIQSEQAIQSQHLALTIP